MAQQRDTPSEDIESARSRNDKRRTELLNNKLVITKSVDKLKLGDTSVIVTKKCYKLLDWLAVYDPMSCSDFKFVNREVTDEVQTQLIQLTNEYRDCFALDVRKLGCTQMKTMELNELEGSSQVVCKPYHTTATDKEAIVEIVADWKLRSIVTEIDSPYASPMILEN